MTPALLGRALPPAVGMLFLPACGQSSEVVPLKTRAEDGPLERARG